MYILLTTYHLPQLQCDRGHLPYNLTAHPENPTHGTVPDVQTVQINKVEWV